MSERPPALFIEYELYDLFQENLLAAKNEINHILKQKLLASSHEEIVEQIFAKYQLTPLTLFADRKTMARCDAPSSINTDPMGPMLGFNSGPFYTISMPFEGDSRLWQMKPSQWSSHRPHGHIILSYDDSLSHIEIMIMGRDKANIEQEIKRNLDDLNFYMENSRKDVEKHNQDLRQAIASCAILRRQQLEGDITLAKELNIPLNDES